MAETQAAAVDAIKIKWSGDARSKFKNRKVRARVNDEGPHGDETLATLDRLKTRVVVESEDEAIALESMLAGQARKRYTWTTDAHVSAYERVLDELRDAMEARDWVETASSETAAATDGGVAQVEQKPRTPDVDDQEPTTPDVDGRIETLEDAGLSGREAEVTAWKEQGLTHTEIADEIDSTKSTVDEYSRRAGKKLEKARRLVEAAGELYE